MPSIIQRAFFDPCDAAAQGPILYRRFLLFFSVNGFPYNLQKREREEEEENTYRSAYIRLPAGACQS